MKTNTNKSFKFNKFNNTTKCVHSEHCCIYHGCKYGEDDCPVWLGYKKQSGHCESCWMDNNCEQVTTPLQNLLDSVSDETLRERRDKVKAFEYFEFWDEDDDD